MVSIDAVYVYIDYENKAFMNVVYALNGLFFLFD